MSNIQSLNVTGPCTSVSRAHATFPADSIESIVRRRVASSSAVCPHCGQALDALTTQLDCEAVIVSTCNRVELYLGQLLDKPASAANPVTPELDPRAVLLCNLFRDQLDRYGELETIAERWAEVVSTLPGEARLVGQIMGSNPIPIIVPCHRVLAADGLGGYGPGLELKRRILVLEGVLQPSLFD